MEFTNEELIQAYSIYVDSRHNDYLASQGIEPRETLEEVFGEQRGHQFREKIEYLMQEIGRVPVDLLQFRGGVNAGNVTDLDIARMKQDAMRERHPELDEEMLNALTGYWIRTFR